MTASGLQKHIFTNWVSLHPAIKKLLNTFQRNVSFLYPPWKHQETSDFLMFSGVKKGNIAPNVLRSVRKIPDKYFLKHLFLRTLHSLCSIGLSLQFLQGETSLKERKLIQREWQCPLHLQDFIMNRVVRTETSTSKCIWKMCWSVSRIPQLLCDLRE